jgi:phenylalanyl-tRNA synthetase alpha chain
MTPLENTQGQQITIDAPEESKLRTELEAKTDAESERQKRYLHMPDLSRDPNSPLYEMQQRILALPAFKGFDVAQVPEIVRADMSFDLFNFPADHPARSKSDTYYVNDEYVLRTHTTVMWYYYLTSEHGQKKIEANEPIGLLSYGKVYRKDEIDRHHMNTFHQMDGLLIQPDQMGEITQENLKDVLAGIAKAVFGPEIKYRFNDDTFPYTHESLEMEVDKGGKWVEVLGAGLVEKSVLKNLDPRLENYNGWAFGFGLERLAIISMELPDIRLLWSKDPRVTKQLKLGQKFVEVSKFPPITRDISFIVDKSFLPNDYFDLIRDIGGDLIEEVELLDKYENPEKFGADKVSYTYRVVYRSNDRTLLASEVDPLQDKLYSETAKQYKAELR